MDYILGFVSKADNTAGFTNEYIPVYRYTQFPAFEVVLGLGFVNISIERWKSLGRTSEECSFYIGWRLREDRRINEALLQLYPFRSFSIDLAVMEIGEDGTLVPLIGYSDMLRAFLIVERYSDNLVSQRGYTNMCFYIGFWADCITRWPPHQALNIFLHSSVTIIHVHHAIIP